MVRILAKCFCWTDVLIITLFSIFKCVYLESQGHLCVTDYGLNNTMKETCMIYADASLYLASDGILRMLTEISGCIKIGGT